MPAKGREVLLAKVQTHRIQTGAQSAPASAVEPAFDVTLRPGEQIIWSARSRGRDFSGEHFVVPGLCMALGAFSLWWIMTGRNGPDSPTFPAGLMLWALAWFGGFGWLCWSLVHAPDNSAAVLTNQRLFFRPAMWPHYIACFGRRSDPYLRPIRMLRLIGRKQRPLLKLHGMFFVRTGPVVLGIDRPLEIAQLIKSTLKLDLPVEDRAT